MINVNQKFLPIPASRSVSNEESQKDDQDEETKQAINDSSTSPYHVNLMTAS